jgi:hypothetical protein
VAQHTHITLTDDLDGTEATCTVRFGFEGSFFAIDLNDANAAVFAEVMSKYISAARSDGPMDRIKGRKLRVAKRTDEELLKMRPYNPKAVREWAKANGYDVGDRGRLHSDIVDAYLSAQG